MRARTQFSGLILSVVALGILQSSFAEADVLGAALSESPAVRAEAVSGVAPVLDPVSDMTVNAGETADQPLHATDVDGEPLSFYKAGGPGYMTVTTTNPGTGSATGNVNLAPGSAAGGVSGATVGVSDGQLNAVRSFQITVVGGNVAPVLAQPADMDVKQGAIAEQQLTATDANGDPLSISLVTGPAYMTVATTDPGTGVAYGIVHVEPDSVGTESAVVQASDGFLTDQKSFNVIVHPNSPPSLTQPAPMTVVAGTFASQPLYAFDGDGDPLTFSKVGGPAYMTVTTTPSDSSNASGNVSLSPSVSDVGSTTGAVEVSDGALTDQKSFDITVTGPDRPPIMNQPSDMSATVGQVAEQTVTATDPDGGYLYIYMSSGPYYMSVPVGSGFGSASTTIRIAPAAGDEGVATGSVTAYSNGLTDTRSFSIMVTAGNFPPPCPPGSFTSLTTVFGYGLIEVQTADLNADGVPDIVVEVPGSNRASTALGNGDGTFGPPTELDAGTNPVSGVIADFNRDDIPDIAIVDNGSGNAYVYLGDGTGAFGPRRTLSVGYARSIISADVNRDGKMDLLLANPNTNSVTILRGIGDGTFQGATSISAGYGAWHLAAPDLNADGAPDLVVVNPGDSDISVFRNNGSGAFGSRTNYPVGAQPLAVSTADLDGNGTVDVVVSNAYSASVSVFPGNGNGTLGMARTFSTGYGPRQVAITDLNGDGHLDLATANFDGYNVSILLGDGLGAFGGHADLPVNDGPYGIASADFDDDLRADLAVANYYGGSVTVLLNGCAPDLDHPPVVHAPRTASGSEGSAIAFAVTATDPDGPPLSGLTADFTSLPVGHNATFTLDASGAAGTFVWTPSYQTARPQPYPVTFIATNVLSGSAVTRITVLDINRPPVADAGGPYTAFAGYPLTFDGTGSSDPDGDVLTYLWVFGDGKGGTGVRPDHVYAAIGVYGVALTVSDGVASSLATTTASVVGIFEARAFTSSGNRSIRLSAGKPQWCVNLEPVGRSYSNATIDLGSVVMKSPGTGSVSEIHALTGKTSIVGDRDGNGVDEVSACFSKDDLRVLFSDLHGSTTVSVTFEGKLYTGGVFRAGMDILVNASGGQLSASLSPNPLNPDAVLTFVTGIPGPARVEVFDLSGRRVQRLMDEPSLPAGYHDVRISARREDGGSLASGVYFYRIEAAEGRRTGRFTILK
jgi:hypothetical protein